MLKRVKCQLDYRFRSQFKCHGRKLVFVQECILVRSVRPLQWPSLWRGVCPGGCLSRGVCLGSVCPGWGVRLGGVSATHTLPVDRQTPVKILPCHKLRLRAVNMIWTILHFRHQKNMGMLHWRRRAMWPHWSSSLQSTTLSNYLSS